MGDAAGDALGALQIPESTQFGIEQLKTFPDARKSQASEHEQ